MKTSQPFKHPQLHLSDSQTETLPPASVVPEEKLRVLFALLFSSPEAVTLDRIREVLYPVEPNQDEVERPEQEMFSPQQHLAGLENWMASRDLPLTLHKIGRSWRLLTSEDMAEDLFSVRRQVHQDRLGPAALEVLSLVAYRQPVLKADVDAVRGVKSGPHLRHLLDMRLVRILGRSELPGRPFLYCRPRSGTRAVPKKTPVKRGQYPRRRSRSFHSIFEKDAGWIAGNPEVLSDRVPARLPEP